MKDPVKHCDLYKDEGCAHVDGFLCDFETCSMRLDYWYHEYRRKFSSYMAEAVRNGRKFSRYDGEPPEKNLESSETGPENKKLEKRV